MCAHPTPHLSPLLAPRLSRLRVCSLLNKGVCVRYADEKGEMPLHKLARVKNNDAQNLLDFKK